MLVGDDVRHIVEHSRAKSVLTTPQQADALPRDGDRIDGTDARIVDVDLTRPGDTTDLPVLVGDPVDHPAPDAPAAYVYTGGTTGRSKGVVHTHASLA